jgi:hypothetical protein
MGSRDAHGQYGFRNTALQDAADGGLRNTNGATLPSNAVAARINRLRRML